VKFLYYFAKNNFISNKAAVDECVAAADIYKCGTDKVPDIVDDMVQVAKGSPDIVKWNTLDKNGSKKLRVD
jgi:hypothetical protein